MIISKVWQFNIFSLSPSQLNRLFIEAMWPSCYFFRAPDLHNWMAAMLVAATVIKDGILSSKPGRKKNRKLVTVGEQQGTKQKRDFGFFFFFFMKPNHVIL